MSPGLLICALLWGAAAPYSDWHHDEQRIEALLNQAAPVRARTQRRSPTEQPAAVQRDEQDRHASRLDFHDMERLVGRYARIHADQATVLTGIIEAIDDRSVTVTVRRSGGTATMRIDGQRIRYAESVR